MNAYLGVDANSTYLSSTAYRAPNQALSDPTVGLMMLMSTFQYQASLVSPLYSTAVSQAGKAAFMETQGPDAQNKLTKIFVDNGKDTMHALGITETELGVFLGTAKVLRSRQLDVNGPVLYSVKTKLTFTTDSGTLSLGVRF